MQRQFFLVLIFVFGTHRLSAQSKISFNKQGADKINIVADGKPFATFFYPDTLEKPVLWPVYAADGQMITRGFPLQPNPGDPTDHPHHVGIWFNFENVNGIDFWNNSFAIPANKKQHYGHIVTTKISEMKDGPVGILQYYADWLTNDGSVLLHEKTELICSEKAGLRTIDRITTLTADTVVTFTDAKDGLYAIRLVPALQIPDTTTKKFTDDKGNITVVKASANLSNGNYFTSEGKTANDAWSTRASWCKNFGKMGNDSICVVIIDHPKNINYPTFWHARGYGLFAANPLGDKVFTNGKHETNFNLKKNGSVSFRYRIIIQSGSRTLTPAEINKQANEFATK